MNNRKESPMKHIGILLISLLLPALFFSLVAKAESYSSPEDVIIRNKSETVYQNYENDKIIQAKKQLAEINLRGISYDVAIICGTLEECNNISSNRTQYSLSKRELIYKFQIEAKDKLARFNSFLTPTQAQIIVDEVKYLSEQADALLELKN
jgi:hypothetical protein